MDLRFWLSRVSFLALQQVFNIIVISALRSSVQTITVLALGLVWMRKCCHRLPEKLPLLLCLHQLQISWWCLSLVEVLVMCKLPRNFMILQAESLGAEQQG